MLYHLFRYLDEAYDLPGSGMFQYISFRAAAAIILSLLIVIIFGRSIIDFLRRKQIGEEIRDLGLQGQLQKKGTPTMGGVIILVAILVPMLLFGKLDNVYIQLLLVSTVWLGLIGGLDDYIKVFRHRKEGLKGRFKIVGQVGLGVIVGTTMWLSPDIVVREKVTQPVQTVYLNEDGTVLETVQRHVVVSSESLKTTQDDHPLRQKQRVRLRMADGRKLRCHMDSLRAGRDFRGDGRVERRQPHRRPGRSGDGSFGPDRRRAGGAGLSFGPHRLCRLPQYHVHPGQRRDGGLRRGAGGGAGGFPVVQLLSRPRSSWATPGSLAIGGVIAVFALLHPQGAAAAAAVRRLPRGDASR